jgi:hypothetical protein
MFGSPPADKLVMVCPRQQVVNYGKFYQLASSSTKNYFPAQPGKPRWLPRLQSAVRCHHRVDQVATGLFQLPILFGTSDPIACSSTDEKRVLTRIWSSLLDGEAVRNEM